MVTVYVDILIILNAFVNFFILLVTSAFCRERPKTLRIVLASFVGAAFSLYIFLPSVGFAAEVGVRLLCSAVTVFTCFGRGRLIRFIRLWLSFYAASFLYAGIMIAVWFTLRPESMAVNNGIVYIDISPLLLVGVTLVSYTVLSIIRFFGRKNGSGGETCGIKCKFKDREMTLTALIDTGHSLRDDIGGLAVIIVAPDKMKEFLRNDFEEFCGDVPPRGELGARYRMIPCKTVGGSSLLKAVRCDSITVHKGGNSFLVKSPLLAMSNVSLGGDYDAIVGTDVLPVTV